MKTGITGTQRGLTTSQAGVIWNLLRHGLLEEIHHGCCVGVDEQVHGMAVSLDLPIHCWPPTNRSKMMKHISGVVHDPAPYLKRNRFIVDSTKMLIGFPRGFEEELRSGTWSTLRYARRLGRPYLIIYPNGETSDRF